MTRGRPATVALAAVLATLALAACAPRAAPPATEHPVDPGVTAAVGGPAGRPSPGCAASPAPSPPDRLTVAGVERRFVVRVPVRPTRAPRDLVLVFHGRTNDADQVRRYAGLDAALPDAIVVYPRALAAGPGAFAWTDPGDPPERLRDFALVVAVIEAVGAVHCVDLDRVFVVGHSLGAYFANDVACRLGDRVRAVASVAGGLQNDACVGGTAALLVHHSADRLVPIAEGERARDAFLVANGIAGAPAVPAADAPLARLGCARHGDPGAVEPVVWCVRDDATTPPGLDPHTWPEGAATAIAAFFASLR